jgi:hypothetical protein
MDNGGSITREDALTKLEKLRREYAGASNKLHTFNEAETRLYLIDRILNALGWPNESFNPEKRAANIGFLDYLLMVDGTPFLVVEAKRGGDTFHSPTHRLQREQYKLSYLRNQFGKPVTAVIEQAEKYAYAEGVSYALLTNGAEWILAQVRLPPGCKSTDELVAIYFGNIFSDDFRFNLFWELLNRQAVEEGILEEQFGDLNCQEAEYTLYPSAEYGTLQWHKPSNNRYLRRFYEYFFTDITDPRRRRMLERCYVSDARLDQYQGELQRALQDTSPNYLPDAVEISPGAYAEILASDTGDRKGPVVIVTGSVGCGKSTFIAKVLRDAERANRELKLNRIYILIDLIDEFLQEEGVIRLLWDLMYKQWIRIEPTTLSYDVLKKIFQGRLASIRQGGKQQVFDRYLEEWIKAEGAELDRLQSSPEEFLPACWKYYLEKKRTGIALIFDNVDKASESFQRQVYTLGHKIARETGITIVITMRESTFLRGQEGGFLDVRPNDRVFHLQYPTLEQVLSKRIGYIEDSVLNSEDDARIPIWKQNLDWTSFSSAISIYASDLKKTFLIDSSTGRKILGLLASVAWHDVRAFLRLLRTIHVQLGNTNVTWTLSDALAVLMTPSDLDGTSPAIPNIFAVFAYPNYNCYFLKLRILLFLNYGLKPHQVQSGTSLDRILRLTRLYGYRRRWTEVAIEELVQNRLLECLEIPAEEDFTKDYSVEPAHTFRRSALGLISLEEILTEPVYLSLIGNNLPFHKPHAFEGYTRALETLVTALNEGKLQHEAVELLSDDRTLAKIVARYLVGAYEAETPAPNIKMYSPEISMTEQRLEEIVLRLRDIGEIRFFTEESHPRWVKQPVQQTLFDENQSTSEPDPLLTMPRPRNLQSARVGKSTTGPLIFWALVTLREKLGTEFATGSQITTIINSYLVDEHDQKEPTNVSRALRGVTLASQKWLISEHGPLYGVVPNWEPFWEEIFGEPAPNCGHD